MEIKKINNQKKEAFIQNLEKGFMVSNGVYADNFINRKLGRVGQSYKKGKEKDNKEESVVGKVKGKVKEFKDKASKVLFEKRLQTRLNNANKDILEDKELGEGNVIKMSGDLSDGLEEAKKKYGFEDCYYTTIEIGDTKRTFFAAKDKKGNISWFGAENELLANHTPIFDERNNFVKYIPGGMDLDGVKKSFAKSKKYDKEVKEIHKKVKKGEWKGAPGPLVKKHNPFE